ncbi:HxlR family transcriptional regulator [Aestuariispira insulae]|uniref:HxlR family transcriptional regulator n=1 Tax=Aestuariispira insulae TaxID=1461337 RepID=A0A3D9HU21_9PROT|nr:HxlR family transcriptional regulator [Aestuariispira insulae]
MDINLLVNITARAWSLKILALLHEGVPGRQAPLLAATGAGRSAFAASLDHLAGLGLLERNPGHGHPLRPEFRLTAQGLAVAPYASAILSQLDGEEDFALIRKSWTVPVLALITRPRHFTEIRTGLGAITDRALSQSLGLLEDHQWLSRNFDYEARRPRPLYQAINRGQAISQVFV